MSAATKELKTWSKSEEIAWLRKAIKTLGPRSYLGPWLFDAEPSIRRDIENDVVIEAILPGAAYRHGQEIVAQAKVEAEQILTAARLKAADEYAKTREDIAQSRAVARRNIEEIARRL